jgi:Zn-finger nucleic acid-binding protein
VPLIAATRHKIAVQACPSCEGMWFDGAEFQQLEDEAFHLDEHAKGTLAFSTTATDLKCPACAEPLKRFNYRLYDLELELCERGDGYWLDKGEDARVIELMRKEEQDIDRSQFAEDRWTRMVRHMHSGGFIEKVRDLFR